jgi:ferrochelatase
VLAGDPYYCFCEKTARLIAEALQLEKGSWSVSYQSRLGKQPWLQPYTDLVIPQLARSGVSSLDVICPGFAADCLETLEEVALRYRDDFINAVARRSATCRR